MRRTMVVMMAVLIFGLSCGRDDGNGRLRLSGTVEATTADLSFKVPGRLRERFVDEGEAVAEGAKVAKLEETEYVKAADRYRAGAEAAKAAFDELRAGFRGEDVAQAAAAESGARADYEKSRSDFARIEALYKDGVASKRDHDFALSARDAAKAKLDQAVQQHLLMKRGARKEQVEAARAQYDQAEAASAEAEIRLGDTLLLAPFAGTVLSKHAEEGEFLSAGAPVVTVGDIAHPWIRAYLEESDLGRVKIGAPAQVKTDTFPGKSYKGKVTFISSQAEFTPKTIETKKERVKLVYRIKIEVDNPEMELKPGMPADVEIETGK